MSDLPFDRLISEIEWRPAEGTDAVSGLHVTHEGVLIIGDIRLRCYLLSDGSRVFDAEDVERIFGDDDA